MKQKLWVLLVVACVIALLLPVTVSATMPDGFDDSGYYYYRDGQMVKEEIIEHEGKLYAFDEEGWRYTDSEFYLIDSWYRAKEDGTLYVNEWLETEDGNYKIAYYGEGGKAQRDFFQSDGVWYFLHNDGYVARGMVVWSEDYNSWYEMSEDGKSHTRMPAGRWYQDSYGMWYYPSADGSEPYDFVKVGNKWYFIGWNCCLLNDKVVWSVMDQKFYALSADGESYQALPAVPGWHQAYGKWYYAVKQDGEYPVRYIIGEAVEYNGNMYYLHDNGQMAADELVEFYDNTQDTWVRAFADENGILKTNGWFRNNGRVGYMRNGEVLEYGAYEIAGKLYLFDWNGLITKGGEHYIDGMTYLVIEGTGEVVCDKWVYSDICYEYEKGWTYYDVAGQKVRDCVCMVGDKYYAFNYYGIMRTNELILDLDGTCVVDQFGVATWLVDGWHQDPANGEWVYVQNGFCVENTILELDGKRYAFDGYYLVMNGYCSVDDDYVLADKDGVIVTKPGWYYQNGWYYIQDDGYLYMGWLQSGGKWYMMSPHMITDYLYYEAGEKLTYAIGSDGVATALKKNGLVSVGYSTIVYMENGKAVTNTWKQISGYWYYFDEYGFAYQGGIYAIDNRCYLFNTYGQMASGGWVTMYGAWYYADPAMDSALTFGLKTIGGTTYLFDEYAEMCSGGGFEYSGSYYLIDNAGCVLMTLQTGWNQYKNDWYYLAEDGHLARNEIIFDGDKAYAFDRQGKMLRSGVYSVSYDTYVIGADGAVLTGWQKVNGKWMYWHPETLYRARYSVEWIDGKTYIFDRNGYLMIGTFNYSGYRYTTNSDGEVIKQETAPDGWSYFDGIWYYNDDGDYTGWMGEYYIEHGEMMFNTVIEHNGKHYMIQADGRKLKSGWGQLKGHHYYGKNSWVLARADGSLYCSEWVKVDGVQYYFSGHYMVSDAIIEIDGKTHEFDENGKWLGEYKEDGSNLPTGKPDGWQKISGNWYYFMDGTAVTGQIYWKGDFYLLDYETGIMATRSVGYYNGVYRYYNADGVAVNYVGWKQIDGQWYLFNPDGTLYFGLAKDSAGLCYVRHTYTKDGRVVSDLEKSSCRYIGGSLYYFDANGYTQGAITTDGWHHLDGAWYYIKNGALVDGYHTIGGATYFFYDGYMAYNEIIFDNSDIARYVDSSGKVVTKQGWHQIYSGEWVYVCEDGSLYTYGIYKIGGKEYTFYGGVLVSE